MASENIGSLFPTKIPGYDDAADIQAALRLYHYGSETYDSANSNLDLVPAQSVAGHLKALQTEIETLEDLGIGSEVSDSQPTEVVDGYIWVDSDAQLGTDYSIPYVLYQNLAPTENLSSGMLWVDKDSSPLTLHVYDEDLGWRAIGS